MNKEQLIQSIMKKTGYTNKQITNMLNAEHSTIIETVGNNEKVKIVGFGTYEARAQSERKTKTPKTKDEVVTRAKMVPKFNPSKQFKGKVNRLPVLIK